MILLLAQLPNTIRSIYNGPMPKRMRFLHPEAAISLLRMEKDLGGLIYSDMYRSAESSLEAMQRKAGVQPPAYSGHNYGFSVDVAVDQIMNEKGWDYERLLDEMIAHGWFCHRRDHERGMEDWHFNCLGPRSHGFASIGNHPADYPYLFEIDDGRKWGAPVEKLIQDAYGDSFSLDSVELQISLSELGLYKGDIDGIIGPITMSALHAFQRAWELPETSPNYRTQRTLAFVSATIQITPVV